MLFTPTAIPNNPPNTLQLYALPYKPNDKFNIDLKETKSYNAIRILVYIIERWGTINLGSLSYGNNWMIQVSSTDLTLYIQQWL